MTKYGEKYLTLVGLLVDPGMGCEFKPRTSTTKRQRDELRNAGFVWTPHLKSWIKVRRYY